MDKLIIGCGYLGSRVARRWQAAGHRVWVTTRTPARADELRRRGWQPVLCDVLKPGSLQALPRADTVLYAVGFDRSAGPSMQEVYVTGLGNVLQQLQASHPPHRFLYVGSTSVYGQTNGEWVDETAATEPTSVSGRIALEAEACLRQAELASTRVVLRFAGIYGPGRLIGESALRSGSPLTGVPSAWLNLIHVDDGAKAILAVEKADPADGIYNIVDDEPVRRQDFYEFLAGLLRTAPPLFRPATDGTPATPGQETTNRRISNQRMKNLPLQLDYSNYRVGLAASLSGRE
jgi:nucleoside-diphosphate-sugar epimerase